jgi:hypothetical protein
VSVKFGKILPYGNTVRERSDFGSQSSKSVCVNLMGGTNEFAPNPDISAFLSNRDSVQTLVLKMLRLLYAECDDHGNIIVSSRIEIASLCSELIDI